MDFKSMVFVLILRIIQALLLEAAYTQPQFEHFTAAVTNFSSELYQHCLESTRGNVVISSYSAVNALVLLSQATDGNTLYQMKSRLNFSDTKSDLLDYFVAYQNSIKESARDSTFIVANKLYVQNGYQVNEKFQEVATHQLLSDVEMIDFRNPINAAKIINNFVAEKTQNKMGDIIKPGSLQNADTRIILMSNIYMKFKWENVYQSIMIHHYKKFTTYYPDAFTNYKDIEYVSFNNGWFKYAELNDFNAEAIEIRFADSDFSLLLILPNRPLNLFETQAKLKDYDLTKIIDRMQPEDVYVEIPTFQIQYQTSLKDLSDKLQIFEIGKANLSGLLNNDNLSPISDAILTTVIEVEPGNELDEETDNFLYKLSELYSSGHKKHFVANHPFLYYVWDRKLKTPILNGLLKEFEGKKRKYVFSKEGGEGKCFDADGRRSTCNRF